MIKEVVTGEMHIHFTIKESIVGKDIGLRNVAPWWSLTCKFSRLCSNIHLHQLRLALSSVAGVFNCGDFKLFHLSNDSSDGQSSSYFFTIYMTTPWLLPQSALSHKIGHVYVLYTSSHQNKGLSLTSFIVFIYCFKFLGNNLKLYIEGSRV